MYLKQLASRLNQNKTTEKTEAIFFLKNVTAWIQSYTSTPRRSGLLPYYSYAIDVPSNPGGRSVAQHNAPRQGSAMPPEACQSR